MIGKIAYLVGLKITIVVSVGATYAWIVTPGLQICFSQEGGIDK